MVEGLRGADVKIFFRKGDQGKLLWEEDTDIKMCPLDEKPGIPRCSSVPQNSKLILRQPRGWDVI